MYNRYSFGIGIAGYIRIGWYISFADKKMLSVMADTDFYEYEAI